MEPENTTKDVDHNNMSLLRSHLKDIDGWIAKHNSLDVIKRDHPKLSGEQQIELHQELVSYLRLLKSEISNKVEKLKNG